MKVVHDLERVSGRPASILTIGVFDGVHLGHRHLVAQVVHHAHQRHGSAVALTFDPRPSDVLAPQVRLPSLTTVDERIALLGRLGLDLMVVMPFTRELARVSARDFMRQLCRKLNLLELWVGPDFALGRGREGNVATLTELGRELHYEVRVTEPLVVDGEVVSSTRVRNLIALGSVEEAARLLGRPHTLPGRVVRGRERGRLIGFPTANLAVSPQRALPANGVYAGYACLPAAAVPGQAGASGGLVRLPAVTNVGSRPTFNEVDRTVEMHVLDFAGDLYGLDLTFEVVAHLRAEQRFSGVEELSAQIQRDVAEARRRLAVPEGLGAAPH